MQNDPDGSEMIGEKTRRLVKLAIAVGAGIEGGEVSQPNYYRVAESEKAPADRVRRLVQPQSRHTG
jgi:hypothetical protein